ncbi:MAG: polysaccharide biosynthesis tyrosine autokinase [Proteobacteria bacterium]|nr:polysaccharide biosynthesis tyrosine autokinase [Pseudomonadota bacterium]
MSEVVQFPKPRGGVLPMVEQAQVMHPGHSETDRQIDLRWLLGVLRRRKVIVMFCVAVIPVLVTFIVFNLTPRYQAQARILIEGNRDKIVDIKSMQKDIAFDMSTVETEAEVIRSRETAIKAVERLGLLDTPEFNPALAPKVEKSTFAKWSEKILAPPLHWLRTKVKAPILDRLIPLGSAEPVAEPSREELLERAVEKLLGGTFVIPAPLARVITVQFSSTNPELAARAANTLAELYIEGQQEQKVKASERASIWLTDRVGEMRDQVVDSQRKLEEFRNTAGIVEIGDATLLRQQISQLTKTLLTAETDGAEVRARYERVRDLVDKPGGLESAANVLDSSLVYTLRLQETQLQNTLTELRSRYRDGHPTVAQTISKLSDLRATLAVEIRKILGRLETEAGISDAKITKIKDLLDDLEVQFDYEREAEVTIRALATEVNANKQLYEVLLERLKETDVQDPTLQQAEARIISRAITPRTPVFPRKRIMIFASLLVAIVLGVLMGIGLEYLIPGYRTLQELEQDTGFPVLSMVPSERAVRNRSHPVFRFVSERPHARLSESIRKLRTALSIAAGEHSTRHIAVTSSIRGEGKTSTTLGLAAVSIRAGRRVLVMDCDMRLPNVHTQLGVANLVGMSDLLTGQATFDDVMDFDMLSGIHYVTAGPQTENSEDLLNSEIMTQVIARASRQFDLILFDTPPVLSVSDALVLLPKVDQTVFCVRWEKTPRESVNRALRIILETGARLPGTVLTHVDLNIQRMVYGQDYTYYYYYGANADA